MYGLFNASRRKALHAAPAAAALLLAAAAASATPVVWDDSAGGSGNTYDVILDNTINCDAARAAGVAPIQAGEPGYRPGLDRDGDGTACDS